MEKTRVEINENGEYFTLIPDEVVEDLLLEDGDLLVWKDVNSKYPLVKIITIA